MAIFSHSAAQAATFTVTNLNDSGAGSLRQAIADANATLGLDTIAFSSTVRGTITLTSGQIEITDALTINGPGANVLAISGNNASRIFRLTDTMNKKVLTINRLTLKNANVGGDRGGAIYGAESLLTVNNCTLNNNNANEGGAIHMKAGGDLTVNNSALIANQGGFGGGIHSFGAVIRVNNSTLAYNVASVSSRGSGGGGIHTQGALVVNNSTIFGNSGPSGGGIYITNTVSPTLSVNNSTISGNSAVTGGGIYFQLNDSSKTGAIANSIVAGNTADSGKEIYRDAGFNGGGLLTSLGHNLFGENGSDGLVNVTRVASDWVLPGAIATALGPLQNNGGPTATLLPVPGSLAINRGSNALIPTGVTTDQRGSGFPRIWPPLAQNGKVDIGAVELRPLYALKVTKTGGNGTVTSNPAGVNCGPTCAATFYDGTSVTLTAKPDTGYSFTGWAGDCTGTVCTLTMNAAKNVTALFSNTTTHLLTVTKAGVGLGTVTGPGINCGADCTQPYPVGTKVTLTATATAGSTFGGWSNCDTVNVALRQCTVTMSNARTVKATFNRPLLTVRKTGTGVGLVASVPSGIFCGTDCTEPYNLNTKVTLLAVPANGSRFSGWSNTCVATASFAQMCVVTLNQAKTVTATFVK